MPARSGDTADAGTYWGRANDDAATFDTDAGNPFGGAFIASRSGIAATITYPQNVFSLTAATGGNANAGDIDVGATSTYGVGIGTRTRTASAGNSVESDLIVITGDASTDFGTATDADLTWLSAALETSVTAATGRDDGSDDAQTFTTAYTGTNLVEYRTNRTAGSPAAPLDVASLYLIDNGSDDRLVVTGPDYGSQSYLSGQATNTLSYGGRITAPQLLTGVGGTAHTATHGFTLDIVVATSTSATFNIATTTIGTSEFTIDGGAVDLSTGRLTIGGGTATLTESSVALAQATTFGFAGQIYGATADAVGGTYWGRANDSAATFETADAGKPFGGAFIASRSGIAATITYPQNVFSLTAATGGNANAGDIDVGATSTYGVGIGTRTRTASAGNSVESDLIVITGDASTDFGTATDADLTWLSAALETSVTAATGRDDGSDDAQTFTTAYTGTNLVEYRTNRTAGSPAAPLDVASLYLIDNGSDDRLVVTGPDYGSQSYLSGQATNTLSYGGRITAPQLLTGVGGTAHTATHGFTLDIVVATSTSATFNIATTTIGTSEFTIDGGAVDLSTGRLTIGGGTATLTESSVALAQATTFGFAGQIYGATADAVGGTYWGRANDSAATFETADAGKPFGGAFIASRSGIAATITYPQNVFSLTAATGGNANAGDIDVGATSTYGVGIGTRTRTASAGNSVESDLIVITGDASTDFGTATDADLTWLSAALETSVTAATGRDDGSDDAQTFTTAYTGTNLVEYRTNRTAGSPAAPLDVASLYLIDNGSDDRLVVTGPDYGSQSYLSGQATNTLSYGGRITAPQLLTGVGGTAHTATHGFTLDIVVATSTSATFNIATTTIGTSEFTIDGGAVDLSTGRLTIGGGTATLTESSVALAQATTFGFAGQIYGATADAVGGTYWGRANDSAATFETADAGNPFGGAFIASRSGIATTVAPTPTITYPQNLFDLSTVAADGGDADIDGSGGTTYGSAVGSRYRVATDGATGVTSSVLILSPTAAVDAGTATKVAATAPNGVALPWLGTALEATLPNASNIADFGARPQFGAGVHQVAAPTFTVGYTGANVIAYRTNRVAKGTVAQALFIDDGNTDRIVVSGPEYDARIVGAKSWLAREFEAGGSRRTLEYKGRVSLPRVLGTSAGLANTDTWSATLTITLAASNGTFTFGMDTKQRGASLGRINSTVFTSGGTVNYTSGKLAATAVTATETGQLTPGGAFAPRKFFEDGTFGFTGQIYGRQAGAVGATYWGVADGATSFLATDGSDAGKPIGGAFIGARVYTPEPTISYPQNVFSLTGTPDDIDGSSAASTYGVGIGTRTRTASAGNSVESDLIVITGDASTDFGTATNADLTWLSAALETSVTAATDRDDGSDDAQTFTTAYTGTNLVEYRTSRSGLDVASLYLIDNGADDRIVVTGPDYGSQSYLSGQGGMTLSYGGRITAPQLLTGVGGTTHANTHGFTLDIVVATGGASATFDIATTTIGTSDFTIDGGAVDLSTGRLTIGTGTATLTEASMALAQATTFGFAGQIYGDTADAVGGTYWGLASDDAATFETDDDGNPFGGAFIASFAGSATTVAPTPTITYPQNLFDLATVTADIDGSGGAATYGSAVGSRYRVATDGATGVTSSVLILSPSAAADASTATKATPGAPNGVALAWLGTALETALTADGTRGDFSAPTSATDPAVTFTTGSAGGDVVAYETTANTVDVARLLFVNDGSTDRIVVSGSAYAPDLQEVGGTDKSYLARFYDRGTAFRTLVYTGRYSLPRDLSASAAPTNADTWSASLTLTLGAADGAFAFARDAITVTDTDAGSVVAETFTFSGNVDYTTGKLTYSSGVAASEVTTLFSDFQNPTTNNLFRAGTFGFAGQIYGAQAAAVGGTYWGVGDGGADDGKPIGGAFIGSRPIFQYPRHQFNVVSGTRFGVPGDIDNYTDSGGTALTGTSTYGAAFGLNLTTAGPAASPVTSRIAVAAADIASVTLTPGTYFNAQTSTREPSGAPDPANTPVDIAWLSTALEAIDSTAIADTTRADGSGAEQTFTAAYTGSGVIEYRTNRPGISQIASFYLIDNGTSDRLAVTGPAFNAPGTGTATLWLQGRAGNTLSYTGRLTAPQLLSDIYSTAHGDTHRFTLDIAAGAIGERTSFTLSHTRTAGSLTNTFTITDGLVNVSRGILALDAASTVVFTDQASGSAAVSLFKAGSFGFIGNLYGTNAQALGGIYWGVGDKASTLVADADDNKVYGGAFIASFASSATTPIPVTYPQNFFDLATLSGDIDGSGGTGYGSAVGSRYRVATDGATGVTSSVLILSPTAGDDATTATIDADSAPNGVALAWLGTALEATASATAATGRDDGAGAAQTFTAAYTGTDVIEYRTNRTAGSPAAPLDVASLYLIDNGADDRIVVTGPDYGSQSYLSGQATQTLSYGGRITAPQLLAGVGGTAHANTHGFTLDIVVATGGASATFEIGATSLGASTFTIDGGAVDLGTGRLTIGGGTATLTESSVALAQATTFGFAGQIYGDTADAVGGTYWGRANDDAGTFNADDDGNPFGGAFIASRSGIAATITYPQNVFSLTAATGGNANAGDIDVGATSTYGVGIGTRTRTASAGNSVESDLIVITGDASNDFSTATNADLTWLSAALETSVTAATGRDDGSDDAQTFTTAYTGTNLVEYRTNRTAGSPAAPLDVASLYLIDNGSDDRLVVTGPDYGSQSYLSGQATNTLSYGGRITAPQLLTGVGGTAHTATHGFTLDIVVATSTSATFNIATTTIGTSEFTIDGGAVDLSTGRLTIGGGTATLTESSVALAQATTFGFAGQIYGATADAVGGTYWGRANDSAATFETADAGNPFGGAFIASRSGIAATITYPQNVFSLTAATGGNANAGDIDVGATSTYGVGIGTRTRTASAGNSVESDLIVITGDASTDFGTATDADLTWLSAALETSVTAATGRDDGSDDAQTFTTAYTGTNLVEYRTNRTAGSPAAPLDVASLYLIDNGSDDRLVVTGPDYGSQSYLSGQATNTLSYGGRITAPQLLTGVGGTAHTATHGFTLDIVVATSTSATFNIATTTIGTSEFTIDGGAVDLSTGRLTIGGGTATLTESSVALAQATTFGFAGQIYGATADAVGGTYWGRANDSAATFETADAGKPFGGAFIASRSGIAATITYPQNVFSLTAATGGNANAGDIDVGATSTYGVGIGTRTRTASAGNSVESDLIVITGDASTDFGTATDADLTWLSAALETSVTAATGRDDGSDDAQTFTTAYTGTNLVEYRTNRTAGSPAAPLDVASLYLIDNGSDDRLVVTGPDYGSQSYLSGQATNTLSYGGRITAPQLLTGVGGTAHTATHGFTLDIVVATSTSATFNIATTTIGTSEFTIDGGAVDLSTGRLTIGGGTATLTESSVALAQATTFGFAGQIYGATADAVGGTYWGRANDSAATFETADAGKPFGGAFIASRSGIAATITYPQNVFSLTAATGGNANAGDIDVGATSTYGVGIGTRTRTASAGNSVESDLIVITGDASTDFGTATDADLTWLSAALETSVTAATGRDDGSDDAQTFTTAYTGTNLVEYRTNRTAGSPAAPLDVASLYLIDNGSDDRLVVTGPDYGSQSYLSGQATNTLSYGGRITAPQLLTGVGGTAHTATHGFTLDIVVATSTSATFNIATTTIGTSEFTIDGGAVDLSTGRLTIGGGTATLTESSVALAQATTFGFAGQIYGATADAVGGTYWGRANDSAATFETADAGNPFGGAFIASRSGIATTVAPTPTITYPQNLFDLSTVAADGGDADIDGSGGTTYGSAVGSRYRVATDGATGVTSSVLILSPTAAVDAGTATKVAATAPNGVALPWLGTALEATLPNASNIADFGARPQFGAGVHQVAAPTFTVGYTGANVIAYRTNRVAKGTVAQALFIDDGNTDRIVVSGPEYDARIVGAKSWLAREFEAGGSRRTLEYKGRVSLPRVLGTSAGLANTDTWSATLTITLAASNGTFTFGMDTKQRGASLGRINSTVFTSGGTVNYTSGKLAATAVTATETGQLTPGGAFAPRKFFEDGTFGFTGQIYGRQAGAVGATYWGVADGATSFLATDGSDAGKPIGGAFIGARVYTPEPTITYPINTYVLSDDEDDIDGTAGTATYGAASGTRYFTLSGTSGVTRSEISILSNTAAGDVSTATAGSGTAQGADLDMAYGGAWGHRLHRDRRHRQGRRQRRRADLHHRLLGNGRDRVPHEQDDGNRPQRHRP